METITIIGPVHPPVGGVSTHIDRFVASFAAYYNFRLIDESSIKKEGIPSLKRGDLLSAAKNFAMASKIIIHTSSRYYPLWLVYASIAFILRKKAIIYIHSFRRDPNTLWFKLFSNLLIAVTHKVVTTNSTIASIFPTVEAEILPAYLPPPPRQIQFPEIDALKEILTAKKLGKKIVISNAWRISIENGIDIYGLGRFLSIANYCNQIMPDYFFAFNIADKTHNQEYIDEVTSRIKTNPTCNFVITHFNGDFLPVYSISDIYIRMTTTDGDSISIRDAHAMGCRVMATDVIERPNYVTIFSSDQSNSDLAKLLNVVLESEIGANVGPDDQILKKWLKILES